MDADEFLQRVTPGVRGSRLEAFHGEIAKLRNAGCTLKQVREFLGLNGIEISIGALGKYLGRKERAEAGEGPVTGLIKTSDVSPYRFRYPTIGIPDKLDGWRLRIPPPVPQGKRIFGPK